MASVRTVDLMFGGHDLRSVGGKLERDETESPRFAGVPVLHDHRLVQRTKLSEVCLRTEQRPQQQLRLALRYNTTVEGLRLSWLTCRLTCKQHTPIHTRHG